jgi:DNA invertase Pin-like site-specific DNA recombinase
VDGTTAIRRRTTRLAVGTDYFPTLGARGLNPRYDGNHLVLLHIYAGLSENERALTSDRARAVLAQRTAPGARLGNRANLPAAGLSKTQLSETVVGSFNRRV